MGINYKYPYTNLNEINLDWILEEISKIRDEVDNIEADILSKANKYTDEQITQRLSDVDAEFSTLKTYVESTLDSYSSEIRQYKIDMQVQFENFKNLVDAKLVFTENRLSELSAKVDAFLQVSMAYTDEKVIQNNESIIDELESKLASIKVLNFFTGEKVSIQNMLDTLAQLHVDDGLDYTTIATRAVDINTLIALNTTYTNLVMHANSLIV